MIRIYKIKLMLIPETPTSCAAEIETLLVKFKLTEAYRGRGFANRFCGPCSVRPYMRILPIAKLVIPVW
jgi:hypothetical protein